MLWIYDVFIESDPDTTSQDSEADDTANSEPIDETEDVVDAEDTSGYRLWY